MQAARPTVDHSVANASKTDDFDAVIRSQYTCHPLRFLCMLNYAIRVICPFCIYIHRRLLLVLIFFLLLFHFLKNLKTAFRTLCSLAIRSFANIQPKVLSVGLRFFRSCGPFTTVSHFLYLRNNFERVSFHFEGLLQLGISWRSRHHFEFSADVIFDQKPFRAKHRSTRHLVSQCNKF